ncbi:DNA methyltransferase [Alphaproteobacteria bacterium]|nr:DNA methyltransferase [Alphaproteobacteria bacterium]
MSKGYRHVTHIQMKKKIPLKGLKNKKNDVAAKPVVRPTKSRIRQALFNILRHRFFESFTDILFLEAFGGSGAFSFDAASLGAKDVVCVEKEERVFQILKQNKEKCARKKGLTLVHEDILNFSASLLFDVVFLDPPYFQGLILPAVRHLKACGVLAPKAILILETSKKEFKSVHAALLAESFVCELSRFYGKIAVGFYTQKSLETFATQAKNATLPA